MSMSRLAQRSVETEKTFFVCPAAAAVRRTGPLAIELG